MYVTVSSLSWSDVIDLSRLDWSGFLALLDSVEPGPNTQTVVLPRSHTCDNPCRGGTIQLGHHIVWVRYIKTVTVYLKGQHSVGGVFGPMETKATFVPNTKVGRTYEEHFAAVKAEIEADLQADYNSLVKEWIEEHMPWGGTP